MQLCIPFFHTVILTMPRYTLSSQQTIIAFFVSVC